MGQLSKAEVLNRLRPLLRSRTVLEPATAAARSPTRFGGPATGSAGERVPACTGCGAELTFVAQVATGRPLVGCFTFFYCWRCHPWGRDHEAGRWLVRTYDAPSALRELPPAGPVNASTPDARPGSARTFDARPGTARTFDARPGSARTFDARPAVARTELSLPCGVGLAVHCPELWARVKDGGRRSWADLAMIDAAALSLTGERSLRPHLRNDGVAVGGYPAWVNGPDQTPSCPDCATPMDLLLQIRPTELTDATWADVGTLYLFICAECPWHTALRIQST